MPDNDKTSSELGQIHADYTNLPLSTAKPTKTISAAVSAVKQSIASPETEYRRWRKTFDAFATEIDGELFVYRLTRTSLACYSILVTLMS